MRIGATVRIVAFAIRQIKKGPKELHSGMSVLTAIVGLSWFLYEIMPLVPEGASFLVFHGARWADVLVLSLVVGVLFSGYVGWGRDRDITAEENREEMETAQRQGHKDVL